MFIINYNEDKSKRLKSEDDVRKWLKENKNLKNVLVYELPNVEM